MPVRVIALDRGDRQTCATNGCAVALPFCDVRLLVSSAPRTHGGSGGGEEHAHDASRFRAVLDASPDAVVVVDATGRILQVNPQATVLFGYEQDELLGRNVDDLLPASLRGGHAHHRERFHEAAKPRTMAAGRDLFAQHKDGTEVPVDVSLGLLEFDGRPAVAAFVRDATERRHLTEVTLALQDAAVRRRQALEINDNVVQGLASVIYTLEAGDGPAALGAARRTLAAARSMMNDLMASSGTAELGHGELVRDTAPVSVLAQPEQRGPDSGTGVAGSVRVMVVDDADDLRLLLKAILSSRGSYDVVGEASDGLAALAIAEELQPDVVLLDLAMPRMDGFEALPRLRAMLPDAVIIVLSGFDSGRMEDRALELGADRYLEKGTSSVALLEVLDELTGVGSAPSLPRDPEFVGDPTELGLQKLSHELRTPLTVIRSMIDTLYEQMDALPAAAVREILTAAARNADSMRDLLDSIAALEIPLVASSVARSRSGNPE